MKRIWLFILMFAVTAPLLFAEEMDRGKLEVTAYSGWSFLDVERTDSLCAVCEIPFYSNRTTVEGSMLFGFKAGYYLNSQMEVEGRFDIAPGHNVVSDNSFVCPPGEICPLDPIPVQGDMYYPFYYNERNMVAYGYGADFLYHFNVGGRVHPFAKFGIGGVSSEVDQSTRHDFAFQFGAGAKFDIHPRYGFRLEVVDQLIPDYFLTEDTENNLQVQYGFVFRP